MKRLQVSIRPSGHARVWTMLPNDDGDMVYTNRRYLNYMCQEKVYVLVHSALASMHAIMLIRMLADCGYELQEVVPVQLISWRIRTRNLLGTMCGLGAKVQ